MGGVVDRAGVSWSGEVGRQAAVVGDISLDEHEEGSDGAQTANIIVLQQYTRVVVP